MEPALARVADAHTLRTPNVTRLRDRWGIALGTPSQKAVEAYERAVVSLLAHRADMLSQLESALREDPEFALPQLVRGFALRLLARSDQLPAVQDALRQVEASSAARGATLREALLADALRAWLAHDVDGAIASLARACETHPACLVSMKLHHALCFLHGKHQQMRRSLERCLEVLSPELPGYGYVLGCHAFALEETGAYREALHHARAAIELCPHDAWAYHALLHVLTMQARTREGLSFVRLRGQRFASGNNFVAHIAWHHALFAIAEGELDEALALYDGEITAPLGRDYRDLANCASLLYRLERAGRAVGDRWQRLAELAETRVGDHLLAFADAHYLLALLGAGRVQAAQGFVESVRAALAGRIDHDGLVGRQLGLPLSEGMLALFTGEPERALRKLWPLSVRMLRLGGSHPQRELFELMVVQATRGSGRGALG
jgi:tetratricopeptide (TPR) repeat protein